MIDQYINNDIRQLLSESNKHNQSKFVDYYILHSGMSWVNSYNNIKDHEWPECHSHQDFYHLPDHIQQECIRDHKFSPDIFLQNIKQQAETIFQQSLDIQKQKPELEKFLLDNIHVVKDKKIIDFACNDGRWSVFANTHQGKDIIGVDVREENILIANAIKNSTVNLGANINFAQSNIHDLDKNQKLCWDRDTVFLFGIMYHVHNHDKIIESVCQHNVKHIVIESRVVDSDTPTVEWIVEPTFFRTLGWEDADSDVLVGIPSVKFFDMVFERLGYKRTDEYCHLRTLPEPEQIRALLLYEK